MASTNSNAPIFGLLRSLVQYPNKTLEAISKYRITPGMLGPMEGLYEAVTGILSNGGTPNAASIITYGVQHITSLPDASTIKAVCESGNDEAGNVEAYCYGVLDTYYKKVLKEAAAPREGESAIEAAARIASVTTRVGEHFSDVMGKHSLAEAILKQPRWYQEFGVDKLRAIGLAAVSGMITIVAGDPGSGKTTLGMHIARKALMDGRRVFYISGETPVDEIQMGLLLQMEALTAGEAAKLVYGRMPQEEREMLARGYSETLSAILPIDKLSIIYTQSGFPDATAAINAAPPGSVIIVDHLVHLASQTKKDRYQRDYDVLGEWLTQVKYTVETRNHVLIAFNQFTKEGRSGAKRGLDSQYGGSKPGNIAGLVVTMKRADPIGDVGTVELGVQKQRVVPIIGDNGRPINPMDYTPVTLYLVNRYRKLTGKLPVRGRVEV